jgi:cell division protein FtsI (penicillin-binding protein 3)
MTDKQGVYLWRFQWYFVLFSVALLGILCRYGWSMLTPQDIQVPRARNVQVERGSILDRNGQLLAIETKLGTVSLRKSEVSIMDKKSGESTLDQELCEDLSKLLAPLLNMTRSGIMELITTSKTNHIILQKKVDESTMNRLLAAKEGVVDRETVEAIELRYVGDEAAVKKALEEARQAARKGRKNMQKIRLDVLPGRVYPEGKLASQIIGMVGDDNHGLEGIELNFDDELSPRENQSGKQVVLTIDVRVQHILEKIAEQTLVDNKAEAVMLTAMDPHTGEIMGSASIPDFNPNRYNESPIETWRYNPAFFTYEPGSVFKIFTIASLLDTGAITGSTTFTCTGHYDRVSPSITDLQVHGVVNAEKIIAYSCNVGVSLASDRIENEAFYQKLASFGFGERIGYGSPSERSGIFNPVARWDRRTKPTIAIGQSISVSMLQMLQAATAIANNGVLVQPRLISAFRLADGSEEPYKAIVPRRVLSEQTASSLIQYMRATAANDGTGWRAYIGDIPMAVKTGTAQMIVRGVYSDTDFIASCMAIFPADQPRLVLYTTIVKPQGSEYLGGRIATVPIRDAAEALTDYLGLPRGKNTQISYAGQPEQTSQPSLPLSLPELKDVMPDFSGYAKQSIIPLLNQSDFRIEINGSGFVKRQLPAPGTKIVHGDIITLYLE